MLIFGTRNVGSTVQTGTFFCPVCQQQTNYKRITNRNFAHIFFIPLFPIGGSEEYVECQRCGTPFGIEVLDQPSQEEKSPPLGDYNTLVLACMELVAAVDASVSPDEVQTIGSLYKQVTGAGVDGERVRRDGEWWRNRAEQVYAAAARLAPELDTKRKERLIQVSVLAAFSDNQPQQAEYDCLAQIGQSLGIMPARLKELIRATIIVSDPNDSAQ